MGIFDKFKKNKKSSENSKPSERKDKVSVKWNIVMSWIPLLSVWAYMRIEKFWLSWLINLGAYGFLLVFVLLYAWMTDKLTTGGTIISTMIIFLGFGGYVTIHSYAVKKWSEEWNEKADKFSKELDEYERNVHSNEKKDDTSKGVKL